MKKDNAVGEHQHIQYFVFLGFFFYLAPILGCLHRVQVNNGDEIPCDMLLMLSADSDGQCLITTASLDGETDAKVRARGSLVCSMCARKERSSQ